MSRSARSLTQHWATYAAALVIWLATSGYSIAKMYTGQIQRWGLPYWYFGYQLGFIRRGFLGTLVSPFVIRKTPEDAESFIFCVSICGLALFLAILIYVSFRLLRRLPSGIQRASWTAVVALFLASPAVPGTACACAILLVGWDLSRFLTWAETSTMLLCASELWMALDRRGTASREVSRRGMVWGSLTSAVVAAGLAVAFLLSPLLDCFFDHCFIHSARPVLISESITRLHLGIASFFDRGRAGRIEKTWTDLGCETHPRSSGSDCAVALSSAELVIAAPKIYPVPAARYAVAFMVEPDASCGDRRAAQFVISIAGRPEETFGVTEERTVKLEFDLSAKESINPGLRFDLRGREGCVRLKSARVILVAE